MSEKANEDGVHRLLDIVVEEVSLVDRAANQWRFLVVKRSEEMDDSTQGTGTETPPAEGSQTPPAVEDLNAMPEEPEADEGGEAGTGTEGSPLATAVEALEELTEAVDRIGALTDEEARAELGRLATELRTAADHLAPPATPPAEPPVGSDAATLLASAREALGRLRAAVPPAAPAPAPPPAPTSPAPAADGSAAAVGRLTEQVQNLAATVQAQQARLARIEKRSGLPNSAAPGERVAKTEPEAVGWPLDLNRPMDRDSIDKAVSFHDL